jgi:peptidoglycan hydrolase-like protein with peptidoglycan-binding domain
MSERTALKLGAASPQVKDLQARLVENLELMANQAEATVAAGGDPAKVAAARHAYNVWVTDAKALRSQFDGVFSDRTEKAVVDVQRAHGIAENGAVGAVTWSTLLTDGATTATTGLGTTESKTATDFEKTLPPSKLKPLP